MLTAERIRNSLTFAGGRKMPICHSFTAKTRVQGSQWYGRFWGAKTVVGSAKAPSTPGPRQWYTWGLMASS